MATLWYYCNTHGISRAAGVGADGGVLLLCPDCETPARRFSSGTREWLRCACDTVWRAERNSISSELSVPEQCPRGCALVWVVVGACLCATQVGALGHSASECPGCRAKPQVATLGWNHNCRALGPRAREVRIFTGEPCPACGFDGLEDVPKPGLGGVRSRLDKDPEPQQPREAAIAPVKAEQPIPRGQADPRSWWSGPGAWVGAVGLALITFLAMRPPAPSKSGEPTQERMTAVARGTIEVHVDPPAMANLEGWQVPDGGARVSGRHVFSGVEPRTYKLKVWADGYTTESRSVSVTGGQTAMVNVSLVK